MAKILVTVLRQELGYVLRYIVTLLYFFNKSKCGGNAGRRPKLNKQND
jgi:hypothetical protein